MLPHIDLRLITIMQMNSSKKKVIAVCARVRDQLEIHARSESDMLQGTYPSNTNSRATLGMLAGIARPQRQEGGLAGLMGGHLGATLAKFICKSICFAAEARKYFAVLRN